VLTRTTTVVPSGTRSSCYRGPKRSRTFLTCVATWAIFGKAPVVDSAIAYRGRPSRRSRSTTVEQLGPRPTREDQRARTHAAAGERRAALPADGTHAAQLTEVQSPTVTLNGSRKTIQVPDTHRHLRNRKGVQAHRARLPSEPGSPYAPTTPPSPAPARCFLGASRHAVPPDIRRLP
jgi:hypothetical protein